MADADISLVLNGISPARIAVERGRDEIRGELGVGTDQPLVVAVTRANDRVAADQKDIGGLIAAMGLVRERLPDAALALVGPTEAELTRAGLALPDWARATGFVDRPADYVDAADVVAISSVMEGMSNVACEALMLGRPVATTRVGDHVAIVESAGGRSVPVRDPGALANAIDVLISDPPSPEAVRETAHETLSLDRMVETTSEIYRRLLSSRPV
jgi:glycosyltransferase involved in cell wall biosynthesis